MNLRPTFKEEYLSGEIELDTDEALVSIYQFSFIIDYHLGYGTSFAVSY